MRNVGKIFTKTKKISEKIDKSSSESNDKIYIYVAYFKTVYSVLKKMTSQLCTIF